MGSKTRLSSYCTKRANNSVNLVTSRKINTRLARPIGMAPVDLKFINHGVSHICHIFDQFLPFWYDLDILLAEELNN